jgi:hypothetical protein
MLFVGGDGGNLVSGVDRERPNVLITDRERERAHVGAFFDEGLGRLDIMSSMPNFGCWAAKPGRRGMTSRIPNAPDSATPQRRAGCLGIFGIVEIAQDLSRPDAYAALAYCARPWGTIKSSTPQVRQIKCDRCHDGHRYRQEFVPCRWSCSARRDRPAAEMEDRSSWRRSVGCSGGWHMQDDQHPKAALAKTAPMPHADVL